MVGVDANDDGDATDAGDTTYAYDESGVRVAETTVGGATTTYLIDAANPTGYAKAIEETTGTAVRSYVLGLKVEAQADATNGTLYFLTDGHGSTRALMDASGQVVKARSNT